MNEVELLFTDILNCDRLSLHQNKNLFLDKEKSAFISAALKRRIKGEPIQYILGKAEFMGLEFKVTPDVLIPRQETELLVEKVIDIVRGPQCPAVHSILDIGTGSGCIAVSLARLLPDAAITAIDISPIALAVARQNALLNSVSDRINFIQSDLFSGIGHRPSAIGLIISNPPYIPSDEINKLQPEIQYEPVMALDGGEDGLDFYRRIIRESPDCLLKGGFLVMEIGFNQRLPVENIFKKSGKFEIIEVVKDYNNIDRIIIAEKKWIN